MKKGEKLLKIIQALSEKTTWNGCTENEALAAAEKLQGLMEKYGLTLAELKAIDPTSECEESLIKVGEKRVHPVIHVAASIADFCDVTTWYNKDCELHFLGLPGDVA